MHAIMTKYLSPTNTRGGRIKAWCEVDSVTIGYDHALSHEGPHLKAAQALCDKLGWAGQLICGATPDGYVFVFAPGYDLAVKALKGVQSYDSGVKPAYRLSESLMREVNAAVSAADLHPAHSSKAWQRLCESEA